MFFKYSFIKTSDKPQMNTTATDYMIPTKFFWLSSSESIENILELDKVSL